MLSSDHRAEFERVLRGRSFAFSVLVHADESSPMVDFLATSSVLQACHNQPSPLYAASTYIVASC